jgi:hypothetical protein
VFDITRMGEKSATSGDVFEFIERVSPKDFAAYLSRYGADPDRLNLEIPVYNDPQSGMGVFDVDPVGHYNRMAEVVGWQQEHEAGSKKPASQARGAEFESGAAGDDDDIPF